MAASPKRRQRWSAGAVVRALDNDATSVAQYAAAVRAVLRRATDGRVRLVATENEPGAEETRFVLTPNALEPELLAAVTRAVAQDLGTPYAVERARADFFNDASRSPFDSLVPARRDTLVVVRRGLPPLPMTPLQAVVRYGLAGALLAVLLLVLAWQLSLALEAGEILRYSRAHYHAAAPPPPGA